MSLSGALLILLGAWTNFGLGRGETGVYYHQRLVKDLLDHSGYDQRVRPVRNHAAPVLVKHRMNLYQILERLRPEGPPSAQPRRPRPRQAPHEPLPDLGGQPTLLSGLRLVKDLLDHSGYDQRVRPVRNHAAPVLVKHRMNLYQILEVNEPKQKLVLYVWATQYWRDEFLGWDPKEYGGIESIVLPWNHVWLPDTYLYNSLEMTRENTERWISVMYTTKALSNDSAGHSANDTRYVADAIMQFPAIYQFSCKMNVLLFPFDKQNCTLTFGSWTFDAAGIDFFPLRDFVSFESYVSNEEWRVLSFDYHREVIKYECCPNPWILLHASLVMQRKPLYYIVNLIFPTAVITFIAVVGFFMPASTTGERVEKVNLGITTLLAMSILLLMVSDQMPTTSDLIPLIGWFFLSIILLISLGTVLTSIIILIHQQGHYGKRVPRFMRVLAGCVGQCLFVTKPAGLGELDQRDRDARKAAKKANKGPANGMASPKDELRGLVEGLYPTDASPRHNILGSTGLRLEEIALTTKAFREHLEERGSGELVMAEWEYVCSVLDRFLLLVFSVAVGFVTCGVLVIGSINNSELSLV